MNRRTFLTAAVSGTSFASLAWRACRAGGAEAGGPFLLSADGCGRATGYAETNKIVTWQRKTHVAWLDSVAGGFRVRARSLDHPSGSWSATYTLGAAHDNHGGPALTVDSRGLLHAVYFPHHHPFRYRKSKRPNDASQWEEEIQFGQRCTYPTLVCGVDDTLYLTCRRSFDGRPWQMELWTKRPEGAWQGPTVIARARWPGYSHFQESLAWSPDRGRLHLCCRFHEKSDGGAYGRVQTVAYMLSDDLGATWRRPDGGATGEPGTAETVDVLASGGVDADRILRAGSLAVDAQGRPHLIYSVREAGRSETTLAVLEGDGRWRRRGLAAYLPPRFKDWELTMPGGVTFNRAGELLVTATLMRVGAGEETWGHPTSEVVRLASADGGATFSFELISPPDRAVTHWLPNVEKPTGHNRVPGRPGILYTAGPPGGKNTEILSNRVYWLGE